MTLVPLLSSPSAVGVADVRVVEIVVTRMDGTVAFADTMPVTSDTVTLAPQVTYTPPSEVFTVEIFLKGADGGLLFRGGVQVTLGGDVGSEPVDVPMTYVGPGSDAATVTIDPASGTAPVGESTTFTGQGFRSDGTATLGTPLKWASLDPTIASVADEFSGVVQALQPGTARITATAVRLATGQPSDTALLTVLPALSLVINSVTVTEGDAGTVDAVFTVAQSAASSRTVTVDFATVDGSAVAPADYVANSGTLTFDPGVTSRQVTVTVNGDLLDEGASETFTVVLSGAVNATIQTATGVGTITDDDSPPSLTINNVTVAEGDAGTVPAVFTVTQSAASSQTVTVDFATVDGSAIAPADYAATAGTLTFTPGGPLTQQVTVTVNGDLLDEGASETFSVVLSGAGNATIQTGTGVGTIVDDEGAPSLSIDDVVVTEGDAGTVDAVFTVTQAVASSQTVTVDFATLDGTAVAPSDYVATSGTLTFTPGGPLTQQVTVTVNGDLLDEGVSETFTVVLSSAVNGVIATPSGLGTITDDDLPPSLTINDVTVTEGDGGTVNAVFTVTQSAASAQTVTVGFATADGTAIAPADYVGASGQLAFTPGALTQLVTVTVNGDLLDEGAAETFTVGLSAPSNATILDGTGLGTITDDDLPPSLAIDDVTVVEGNSGVVLADFTVTLSAASGQTVTVDFATSDGSAVAGADYVANSGQLTFTPGDVSEIVTVTVNGDLVDEVDETFTVGLSAPSNATIADGSGLGTITDDDAPPLMVTTTSLSDGIEAVAYTTPTLAATGGDGSYTWGLAGSSGPLPAGLSLTPAGDVVGTPSTPGSFAFTVQVASGDGQTAQQPLSIDVIAAAVLAPALVDSAIALFECGYSAFGWVSLGHEDVLEPTAGVAASSAIYRATPETGDCDASSSDQSWYDQIMEARTLISNASGTGVYDRLSNDWNLGATGEQLMAIAAIYSAAAYDHFGEFYCEMAFDGGTLETPSQVLAQAEQWTDVALVHIATFGDFAMPGAIAASAHNMAYGLRARIRWADGDLLGAAADASQIPQGFTAFVTRDAGPGRRNKIFDAATAVGFGGMLGPNTWWNPAIRSPNPVSGVAWPDPIPFTGYLDLGISPDGRTVDASGYPVLASEPSAVPDPRVQHFNKVVQGPVPRDVPDKYQSESDDIPLVSWREALLIRAEFENVVNNNAIGAIAIVNQLRTSESLPPVSGAYLVYLSDGLDDANEVRYLLVEERRREFFSEGGRYWSTKIQNTDLLWFPRGEGTTPEAGFTLQGGVRLFMPTEEYDLNPNLSSSDRGTGCIGLFGQQQPTGTQ